MDIFLAKESKVKNLELLCMGASPFFKIVIIRQVIAAYFLFFPTSGTLDLITGETYGSCTSYMFLFDENPGPILYHCQLVPIVLFLREGEIG